MPNNPSNEIQLRAYQLWELAGRPPGDNDQFWRAAAAEFEFRRARQVFERRLAVLGHLPAHSD